MFLDLGNRIVSIPHIETIRFDIDKTGRVEVKLFSGDAFTLTPEAGSALRFVFDKNLMPNVLILNLAFVMKNRANIEQALAADRARANNMPVPNVNPAGDGIPTLPNLDPQAPVDINKLGDIQELVSQISAYIKAKPTSAPAEPANVVPIRQEENQ